MSSTELVDENDLNDLKTKQQMVRDNKNSTYVSYVSNFYFKKFRAMFEYTLSKARFEMKSNLPVKRRLIKNTLFKHPCFIEWDLMGINEQQNKSSIDESNPKRRKFF